MINQQDDRPAQHVQNRLGNVIGSFNSSKCPRPLQYESLLDLRHIVCWERDLEITQLRDQPCKIPIQMEGRRATWHVPDFLVGSKLYRRLVEVKPRRVLDESERLQQRSEIARHWAKAQGMEYVVVTEEDLPAPTLMGNLLFLVNFRRLPAQGEKIVEALLTEVSRDADLTIAELAGRIGKARAILPYIWHLVWVYALDVDLTTERLRPGAERHLVVRPGSQGV